MQTTWLCFLESQNITLLNFLSNSASVFFTFKLCPYKSFAILILLISCDVHFVFPRISFSSHFAGMKCHDMQISRFIVHSWHKESCLIFSLVYFMWMWTWIVSLNLVFSFYLVLISPWHKFNEWASLTKHNLMNFILDCIMEIFLFTSISLTPPFINLK